MSPIEAVKHTAGSRGDLVYGRVLAKYISYSDNWATGERLSITSFGNLFRCLALRVIQRGVQ